MGDNTTRTTPGETTPESTNVPQSSVVSPEKKPPTM